MRAHLDVLFWCSAAVIVYTYAGYPMLVLLYSRAARNAVCKGECGVTTSIVIAVHNEARYLRRKLDNLAHVLTGKPPYEIIVVSDGSSDETVSTLREARDSNLRFVVLDSRKGKAAALTTGAKLATGSILLFTDARQLLEAGSITALMRNFADPTVGGVTGRLMLGDLSGAEVVNGESLKTALESHIRNSEGQIDSVVGSAGAFHAIRRALFVAPPEGTLLDDMYIPLTVVRKGFRVVFEPEARVWDDLVPTVKQEFQRKVRTLTGNYQLISLMPWLLSFKNRLLLQFISHKVLRLLSPVVLLLLFLSSAFAEPQYLRLFFWAQFFFYASTLVSAVNRPKWLRCIGNVALMFVVLNFAAVIAMRNAVVGDVEVWTKS